MYRFHVEDPIRFRESIKVTIGTGHANALSNRYSTSQGSGVDGIAVENLRRPALGVARRWHTVARWHSASK